VAKALRTGVLATLAAVCLLAAVPEHAHAQAAAPAAAQDRPLSPEEAQRMKKLEEELRCLVCQNQTLADSQAGLAEDLRRQVRDLIAQGKSNEEIKDYLVQRYGDFVLYRPRVKSATYMLWFGPFALLLVGAAAWLIVQRRSRQQAAAQAEPSQAVDPEERDRARKLLDA
jgi:cytochrome c-type biogenesis protein CcmH